MSGLLLLPFLVACTSISDEEYAARLDVDQDGVPWPVDCDDTDPNAAETQLYYADADGDGFGDASSEARLCTPQEGYVLDNSDCDDSSPDAVATEVYYADLDGDGFGDSSAPASLCVPQDGYVLDDTDCDDTDPNAATKSTYYADADGDGFGDADAPEGLCSPQEGYVTNDTDCDDTDATLSDGQDWYSDSDGDGFGAGGKVYDCEAPQGFVAEDGDCNDGDASVNPAALERCDVLNADEDCNGLSDDDEVEAPLEQVTWYVDSDEDGYGAGDPQQSCDPPTASAPDGSDCDDSRADVSPAGVEVCDDDDADEDCSGLADSNDPNNVEVLDWFEDADGDGFGHSGAALTACDPPAGYVAASTDCDDGAQAVFPGADEYCNDIDDDCDGVTDEDDAVDAGTWWLDADGDGYGGSLLSVVACEPLAVFLPDQSDCDDLDPDRFPGNTEIWYDGIDQNCDDASDFDQDGDGEDWVVYGGTDCADLNAEPVDCGTEAGPAVSCLQLLTDDALAADGDYWIAGRGDDAAELRCDMTNGGWTRVWYDDPDVGIDPGWNEQGTSVCGSFNTIHGGYQLWGVGVSARIEVDLLSVAHSEVMGRTDFVKIDSWDNEIASLSLQSTEVWSLKINRQRGTQQCGRTNGGWNESLETATGVISHTAPTVLFQVDATINQGAGDESWGIDYSEVWVR